ncbi:phage tail assembly chaperone [Veillonella sp.]|uniref:phage tail assembly chaperone n=1 Tax=Veillonella sp. TaxID=1926307 RepID=UPI0025F34018|nr:hypothetical protein [Veillonella sp.]
MSRAEFKEFEVGERKFQVKRFDALTGSYIAFTLFEKILPMIMGNKDKFLGTKTPDASADSFAEMLPSTLFKMSREDFTALQKDCLKVCYEVLPAGLTPVIGANGRWGIIGVDTDTGLILRLTIEALLFNLLGFFNDGGLSSLVTSLNSTSATKSSNA